MIINKIHIILFSLLLFATMLVTVSCSNVKDKNSEGSNKGMDLEKTTLVNTMSSDEQTAYDTLFKAEIFSDGPTGVAATMSSETKAFSILYRSNNSKDLFKKLEKEASDVGKLYSLCALYYLDNGYFNSVVENYVSDKKMVKVQYGCIQDEVRIRNIVKSIEKESDIYGGKIPKNLKEYIDSIDN